MGISYGKVHPLGHRFIDTILLGSNIVEEKLDGSQLNFGVINGELKIHSRSAKIVPELPPNMFKPAVEYILSIQDILLPNYFYHGECVSKPKHNTLSYERTPRNYIIIFDIEDEYGNPMSYEMKAMEALRIGLETVPILSKNITSKDDLLKLLDNKSILGKELIEGVVVKNYNKITPDGRYMVGKFVSERFKERHTKDWKANNPTGKDIVTQLIEELKTEARWNKGVQHLRDLEQLEETPRDIGNLMKEVSKDIDEEETDYIKEKLYKHFIKDIKRGALAGIAEWYKLKLLENLKEN